MLTINKRLGVLLALLWAVPAGAQQQVQGTGTAGAPAGNVLSIQGVASGQVVPISGTITANLGTLNGLFLDATFTGRMPAGASPANGESNTNTALSRMGSFNFIYNGSTWDRWTGAVTGTVTANAGSGTFAISAASLPLPSLAATSTKQSDGTQKTQIVDGSGNVIAATSNNLNVQCANCSGSGASAVDEASMTEGTSVFAPAGGYYKSSITALTTGQQGMVALTPTRSFHVTQYDSSGNVVTPLVAATTNTTTQTTGDQFFCNGSTATPTAVGADGRSIAGWCDPVGRLRVDWSTVQGTAVDVNSGNKSAGTIRIVLATDQPALTNKLLVTPDANSAVNIAQINGVTPLMGNGVTGTGSPRVTLASDTTSNTNPLYASAVGTSSAAAASGCYLASAASTNSTSCKGSAGNFYGFRFVNTTATLYYLRMYNSSSAPTCSSATGFIESIPIPASTSGGGIVAISDIPINYGTGIGFCFTGGSSSTDNTNAATGVFGAILYK